MKPVYDEDEKQSQDTEITLGMSSLLGIFFGSVLICGVFFGFGYSMGRGAARTTAPGKVALGDTTSPAGANPAIAGRLSSTTPPATAPVSAPEAPSPQAPLKTVVAPREESSTRETDTAGTPPARAKNSPAVAARTQPPQAAPIATPTPAATPTAASGPPVMVQIAAVANQEDANILVAALKKHGYQVTIRNEPTDKLLHIQLGPFNSREEAKTMRTKLLADGYNAILK